MIALLVGLPVFPYVFNWHEEMKQVSPLARDIFGARGHFIVMLVAWQVLLLMRWPAVLTQPSPAGLALTIGVASFWLLRLFVQVVYFGVEHWWGKPLETTIHILIVLMLLYMNFVFLCALLHQRSALRMAC